MVEHYEHQFKGFIEAEMKQDLAHEVNHVFRVVKAAKWLCEVERANLEVILPAAYLHDCFSFPKNHPDRAKSSTVAAEKALDFLVSIDYPSKWHCAVEFVDFILVYRNLLDELAKRVHRIRIWRRLIQTSRRPR